MSLRYFSTSTPSSRAWQKLTFYSNLLFRLAITGVIIWVSGFLFLSRVLRFIFKDANFLLSEDTLVLFWKNTFLLGDEEALLLTGIFFFFTLLILFIWILSPFFLVFLKKDFLSFFTPKILFLSLGLTLWIFCAIVLITISLPSFINLFYYEGFLKRCRLYE